MTSLESKKATLAAAQATFRLSIAKAVTCLGPGQYFSITDQKLDDDLKQRLTNFIAHYEALYDEFKQLFDQNPLMTAPGFASRCNIYGKVSQVDACKNAGIPAHIVCHINEALYDVVSAYSSVRTQELLQ
jgi:hypothetical protein